MELPKKLECKKCRGQAQLKDIYSRAYAVDEEGHEQECPMDYGTYECSQGHKTIAFLDQRSQELTILEQE